MKNKNQLQIRLAKLKDIEQLCALYKEFFAHNAKAQPKYYKEGEIVVEYPKGVIESEDEDIFVAICENTLVGFIHIQENKTPPYDSYVPCKYAEIIELFVAEPFRKQSIGLQFMAAVKKWSKERGLAYIEAMVLSNLGGEISFYEKEIFDIKAHIMRCDL